MVKAAILQSALASIDHRNGIYAKLLRELLSIKPEHREALRLRGLDDGAIRAGSYASTPDEETALAVAAALAPYDLCGVPGFFLSNGRWRMVRTAPGYFIPVRDARLRIQALAYRRADWKKGDAHGKYIWLSSKDKPGGISSGAPLHYANPHLLMKAREVIITEGALKADVIAHLLNAPVIAASGVTTFGADFAANLARSWPHVQPVIAFDGDFRTNEAVRMALERLVGELQDVGFKPRVKVWPEYLGKGFDDYLLASVRESEAA
jgi:hypothetical protein